MALIDPKQSPFSLYDFLGYFIPGAVSLYVFEYTFSHLGLEVGLTELTALTKASGLLPFILAAYLAGHAIALLSAFTVERFFIWSFDYPSKSLLRYSGRKFFSNEFSPVNVVKMIVCVVLLPVILLVSVMCFFSAGRPGLVVSLDPLLSKIIRRKIAILMIDKGQIDNPNVYEGPRNSDFFRFVYHFSIENCSSHFSKMQNYVALFGFNRALCFIFCMQFWVILISLSIYQELRSVPLLFMSFTIANVFFFGFAKFYRRFSLEALMAFSVVYQVPDSLKGHKIPGVPIEKRARIGAAPKSSSRFSLMMNNLHNRIRTRKDGDGLAPVPKSL